MQKAYSREKTDQKTHILTDSDCPFSKNHRVEPIITKSRALKFKERRPQVQRVERSTLYTWALYSLLFSGFIIGNAFFQVF